ncbi:hypothetical protein ABW20_dc0101151 [Dactylellina cionopaga]|nr:hypothetical protein ABW20_dc0101151 [Dactylellina cionopaga]
MIMIQERDPTVVNLLKQILDAVSSKQEDDLQGKGESAASSPEGPDSRDQSAPSNPQGEQGPTNQAAFPSTVPPAPQSQAQTPTQVPANFAIPAATNAMPAPAEDPKEEDNFITIPHKHNTAAHKLLRWKTIRDLLDRRYPDNYNSEYYHDGLDPYSTGTGGRLGKGPKEILRLDPETTGPLLEAFLANIYILHPFLNQGPLVQMPSVQRTLLPLWHPQL